MSGLWTFDAFAAALGGRVEGAPPGSVAGVSIDTRTIGPGEAFFAIRGDRFDGHDFVGAAFAAGAGAAVVAEAEARRFSAADGPLVIVEDVLAGLRRLGVAARARTAARIVGVTGSVGKTGTKEALRLALSRTGATHASAASYNNHWGVPLTLSRMPSDTAFGVFEMGMNAPGEIADLTSLVRPHIAIVTTVAPVHLEYLGSLDAIADAKAEIFDGLEPDGTAVLNRDNHRFDRLADRARQRGARVVAFGEAPEADARLLRVALHPDCSCIVADILGEEVAYKLGAPGRHLVLNSLAVLAAARVAGADLALAALALADMRAPKGRGARLSLDHPDGRFTIIDESYNANPASMRAALALLGDTAPGRRGRRIAVLGDMLELGPTSEGLHRELAGPLADAHADLVFAAGPLMGALWEEVAPQARGRYARDAEDLREALLAEVRAGDVIMIKGSLGSRMGPLVEALRARFATAEAEAG